MIAWLERKGRAKRSPPGPAAARYLADVDGCGRPVRLALELSVSDARRVLQVGAGEPAWGRGACGAIHAHAESSAPGASSKTTVQATHPHALAELSERLPRRVGLETCPEPQLLAQLSSLALGGGVRLRRAPERFALVFEGVGGKSGSPVAGREGAGGELAVEGTGAELLGLRAALAALCCADFGRGVAPSAWFPRDAGLRLRGGGAAFQLGVAAPDGALEVHSLRPQHVWGLVDCLDVLAEQQPGAFPPLPPLPGLSWAPLARRGRQRHAAPGPGPADDP